jgi:ABC-type molybdate transport system substrate-binding protein
MVYALCMRHLFFMGVLLFSLPASAALDVTRPSSPVNLTILADEEMLLPLTHLVRSYAKETGTPCTVVRIRSEETAQQIEQGLEAHVLISADRAFVNRLTEQGLTDVTSRRAIARTQLALVTASQLSQQAVVAKRISFASMLAATQHLPVFIDAPTSYEGARAQALLTGQSFSEHLATRMTVQSSHEEVLEALRDSDGLALILGADEISPPVTFEAVVLGSESMGEARKLVHYLTSRSAQRSLAKLGFQPPH